MAELDFNQSLDKITEREVVFDFFSRLSLGYNLNDPDDANTTIFNSGANVKNILAKTIMALPTTIALNLADIHTKYIEINTTSAQTTSIEVLIPKDCIILLAYAERARVDLKDLFEEISIIGDNKKYRMKLDIPYNNSEIIKFYYMKGSNDDQDPEMHDEIDDGEWG